MIGLRIGTQTPTIYSVIGVTPGASTGIVGVTRDSSSLVYTPASAAEWTTLLTAAGDSAGGPSALYLCQEASGNLADSIGTFTLTASGTGITYAQTVAGWSRKAVVFNDGGSGAFGSTDVGLPDLSTTSFSSIWYWASTSLPAANRMLFAAGAVTMSQGLQQATGVARFTSGVNSALGAVNIIGPVRPWVPTHNKTASLDVLYLDAEKVTSTFSALTAGSAVTWGQSSAVAHPPGALLYGALFFGSAAERTSTQWKTLLTTLGFNPLFV
jgi:hypothetical protein